MVRLEKGDDEGDVATYGRGDLMVSLLRQTGLPQGWKPPAAVPFLSGD
jgi:hypothetical protein